MTEIEARLERIEGLLAALNSQIVALGQRGNPLEAIGKLMESELVTSIQEKAEAYESFTKQALKDIYKAVDRVESKVNLLSGHLIK
jgi:hypothetical protein